MISAQWRVAFKERAPNDANARSLLIYARRRVADLLEAGGWDAEYPRGVWQLRRLGHPGNQTLDFTGIPQRWLRDLAKRCCAGGWAPGCTWRSPAAGCAR